jgi:ubiquinol-cytochrome c reductase cytochrome b subunit
VIIHLTLLHETGSSNPIGSNRNQEKSPFHPYFSRKDLTPILLTLLILASITSHYPNIITDPENFNEANPLRTPTHIQPE